MYKGWDEHLEEVTFKAVLGLQMVERTVNFANNSEAAIILAFSFFHIVGSFPLGYRSRRVRVETAGVSIGMNATGHKICVRTDLYLSVLW